MASESLWVPTLAVPKAAHEEGSSDWSGEGESKDCLRSRLPRAKDCSRTKEEEKVGAWECGCEKGWSRNADEDAFESERFLDGGLEPMRSAVSEGVVASEVEEKLP